MSELPARIPETKPLLSKFIESALVGRRLRFERPLWPESNSKPMVGKRKDLIPSVDRNRRRRKGLAENARSKKEAGASLEFSGLEGALSKPAVLALASPGFRLIVGVILMSQRADRPSNTCGLNRF